jgi:hypothetical protein
MPDFTEKQSPELEDQHSAPDRQEIPSELRLKANRENAKKSTGPRTPRGKAHSRRNSLKHGLSATHGNHFLLQNENGSDYQELLEGLRADWQPVGDAEELEVQRIAESQWRLERAKRFETAINHRAVRDSVRQELAEQYNYCSQRDKGEEKFILSLQKLSDEIDAADQPPTGLREKLLELSPGWEMWPLIERSAQMVLVDLQKESLAEEGPLENSQDLVIAMIPIAKSVIERMSAMRMRNVTAVAFDQHAVPNSDDLERLRRYETAADRYLRRAQITLERLQRRRKGESAMTSAMFRLAG